MTDRRILIGVVYNRNGIATWCIEAAKALMQAGHKVVVITTAYEWLPPDLQTVALLTPKPGPRGFFTRVAGRIQWWLQFLVTSGFNDGPVKQAFMQLQKEGNAPHLVLVAQTDFLWPGAPVPQWVVARSWPISLQGYLSKMKELKSQPWLHRLHDLLFWYRMDHKAFRHATGVLAITNALASDLSKAGYQAARLYPCVGVQQTNQPVFTQKKLKLLTAALHIDDRRKNLTWMLEALAGLHQQGLCFDITVVGEYSPQTKQSLVNLLPQLRLTGRLKREELMAEMADHNIFLFASLQENWGYVLIEAIAQGMAVYTPDVYPFQEINTFQQARFRVNSQPSFQEGLTALLQEEELLKACLMQQQRTLEVFTHTSFANNLLDITGK